MSPEPGQPAASERPADWESFYRDYRKPGYVEGFEITTKLGGGMFGLVYRARRMSIGKDYAIKFLQVEDGEVRRAVLPEPEQVKYFAQIDHPNLVSIEDRGEVDGIPYLVMAFAGTETLRDRMVAGRVPEGAEKDELVRAFLQAARGLAALHERSLVHFDIKPANVFLKGSVARLGDYGLSKLVTHSRGSLSMGRGTPYYMAPEMLQRRGDQRSDIYSLGVMLYELLCGEVPFRGDSEWEVLKQHETAEPRLPAHLTAVERAVIARCLQKDPQQRFQSVAELLAAFGRDAAEPWLSAAQQATHEPAGGGADPAEGTENPYRELSRASQKAFRHASQVAREAMREAHVVARKATREARHLIRDTWRRSRGAGMRHRRTFERVGAAVAAAAGRAGRGLGKLVALLLVLVLVAVALLSVGGADERRSVGVAFAPPPRPLSASPTFNWISVPEDYDGLVTRSEPEWAWLADQNPAQAKRALLAHIERLRRRAPLSLAARRQIEGLPGFGFAENDLAVDAARARLTQVLVARESDDQRLRRLVRQGPLHMAVAAERMTQLSWQDPDQAKQARRLHEALRSVTTCRDIGMYRGRPDEAAAYNHVLGRLWMWFVNEFAHSERAWRAYRNLLGLR